MLLSLPDLTVIQQEPDLISFQLGWEQLLLTPHELEEHQYSCYEKNNNSFLFSRNGDFFLGLEKVPGNDKLSLYDIEGNLLHTVELGTCWKTCTGRRFSFLMMGRKFYCMIERIR